MISISLSKLSQDFYITSVHETHNFVRNHQHIGMNRQYLRQYLCKHTKQVQKVEQSEINSLDPCHEELRNFYTDFQHRVTGLALFIHRSIKC